MKTVNLRSGEALAILGGRPTVEEPPPLWPIVDDDDRAAVLSVLESRIWGGYHPVVGELESRFSELHGATRGIATANGTLSLEIALAAAGIGSGDEVIVPPITFVASATAILRVGAVPVFVDVEGDTLNVSPAAAERAITQRTRAIVAVHFAGHPVDLDAFVDLCDRHHLVLIEDCAHAPGASWRGRPVGSFGAFGSFSFQASKNLTAGEGGMLVTSTNGARRTGRQPGKSGTPRGWCLVRAREPRHQRSHDRVSGDADPSPARTLTGAGRCPCRSRRTFAQWPGGDRWHRRRACRAGRSSDGARLPPLYDAS